MFGFIHSAEDFLRLNVFTISLQDNSEMSDVYDDAVSMVGSAASSLQMWHRAQIWQAEGNKAC